MMTPVFFILVSLALTSAMLSVIFYMAWKTQGHKQHALTWSIAFLAGTVHWIINLAADTFPSRESYWLISNAVMLTMLSLGLLGHCQRIGYEMTVRQIWAPAAAVMIAIAWYTLGSPHMGMRTGLAPAFAAYTLFFSAVLILNHRRKPRPAECAAAMAMMIFALAQVAASGAAFLQGPGYTESYANVYYLISFLVAPAAYTGVGMFVIFMLASDLSEQMKEIAIKDQLTGLLNRRGFSEAAARAYATSRRTDRPVSVIMTDIDLFKNINDEFGHNTGDLALCHFADILGERRRDEDILARNGGEEFALVLPGTQVEDSIKIATELCTRLEATPMATDLGSLVMTASFGVATISINDTCLSDVVVRADAALYRSKRAGRNRIDLESSQLMLMPGGELKPVTS